MEKRTLTKNDIDMVREVDGFPNATDEDIISLSRAPYYTACPNPFISDFISENTTPYDEETDDYHCEPFASDISEGKSNPIYNAHAYHTKVPYKAIMRYILHYTKPGDVVYDGFCGTGMTGVAAQMCGHSDEMTRNEIQQENGNAVFGKRKAVLNDLSPAATFISYNYNAPVDVSLFSTEAHRILSECKKEYGWMYETNHIMENGKPQLTLTGEVAKGQINYIVWSDVFICPNCSHEVVFWDQAIDHETGKLKDKYCCPNCNSNLGKRDCERAKMAVYDDLLQEVVTMSKQVPVLLNYTYGKRKYDKKLDESDLELIKKINSLSVPYWVPTDSLPNGYNTAQPIRSHGVSHTHQFYSRRNLIILSALYHKCELSEVSEKLKIWFTSQLVNISKLNRHRIGVSFPYNPLSGTLYISSMIEEANCFVAYENKLDKMVKAYGMIQSNETLVSCQSSTQSLMPDNCIDYIFTDPPFGGNLNYSELSFIWESWLKVKTNNEKEAICNDVQHKGLLEYQDLMTKCFSEFNRVLKPNRWMTVEFHNSKNSVWNAIQEALLRAGFVIADVRTLDKQQGSFKQVTTSSAVKQDLIISAYKPTDSFAKEFNLKAGTERTAWAFVRQHLSNVPVAVKRGGKLEVIAEREAFLLWDRMVAYHIMRGIAVPMDANDFYRGLDERYLKRDNMYFLPAQVNQYDKVRASCEVENVQLSFNISDEKSAIGWLYGLLDPAAGGTPQTYQDIMPKFMQELKAVDKREKLPELSVILEENFLKDDHGKWYIPDYTKSGDVAKLREKNLLKEFAEYQASKGKLKVFRSEAIRAGFAKLWKDKDFQAIVAMAERLPEETIQEDSNLLMYYDISLSRAAQQDTQMSFDLE